MGKLGKRSGFGIGTSLRKYKEPPCKGGDIINIKEANNQNNQHIEPDPPILPSKMDKLEEVIKGLKKKRKVVPQNNIKFHFT